MNTDISYCFSSPEGDIPLSQDQLSSPFLLAADAPHPTLLLKEYFAALHDFFYNHLPQLKNEPFVVNRAGELLKSAQKVIVRSEKHGALYHIASIELISNEQRLKFTLTSALSEEGCDCLRKDFRLMGNLAANQKYDFLPCQLLLGETLAGTAGQQVTMLISISEWLEDFHEWHLSPATPDAGLTICLWDYKKGNRWLDRAQEKAIIRQAAQLLTSFFDPCTMNHIWPWHHAAGDFIVRSRQGELATRLITVRDYRPLLQLPDDNPASPLAALFSFFLHLGLRMRLDKIDGVGEIVWFDEFAVQATLDGFLDGYALLAEQDEELPAATDLVALLASFGPDEFEAMCHPLLALYEQESAEEALFIQERLQAHLVQVCETVRNYCQSPTEQD